MVIEFVFPKLAGIFRSVRLNIMAPTFVKGVVLSLALLLMSSTVVLAQAVGSAEPKSIEVSEVDGAPVIFKHLPDAENAAAATLITSASGLKDALGDRPVLDAIDFRGGTEAAAAEYPAGRLLLVEFTNPQSSIDADEKILRSLAGGIAGPPTAYRRIGNYNAFVFDGSDAAAANALLDQIKYEKTVQWLGEDPFLLKRAEKYFVSTTRDIFISTVIVIVLGIGGSILAGIIAGYFFFRFRDGRRARTTAFSDAGGLTRLNIDDLTSEISAD